MREKQTSSGYVCEKHGDTYMCVPISTYEDRGFDMRVAKDYQDIFDRPMCGMGNK